jgi:hypothetical protein
LGSKQQRREYNEINSGFRQQPAATAVRFKQILSFESIIWDVGKWLLHWLRVAANRHFPDTCCYCHIYKDMAVAPCHG